MTVRLAAVLLLAVFLPGSTADPAFAQQATSSGKGAKAGSCGCPEIKPIATSDKPDPGHVYQELSLRDLEGYFSNREASYDGDWDKALLALAHEIDPGGTMKIWTRPAPRPVRDVELSEGGLSGYILGTPGSGSSAPRALTDATRYGGNDSARVMNRLIDTLARCNKYGEPQFGLRKATLQVARFLAGDLANVPRQVAIDPSARNTAGGRAFAMAFAARRMLWQALAQAGESLEAGRGRATAVEIKTNEDKRLLPLDVYDRANAALDIALSQDESGKRGGLFAHQWPEDAQVAAQLAHVASLRRLFGGQAPPDSPADAVACKALSVALAFSDLHAVDGAKYRASMLDVMMNPRPHLRFGAGYADGVPMMKASRAILIVAGIGSLEEGGSIAERLNNWATAARGPANRDSLLDAVTTMRDFDAFATGPGKPRLSADLQRNWNDTERGVDDGTAASERDAVAAWKASRPDWDGRLMQSLCAPEGTPPRVLIFAKSKYGLILIPKFYSGIPLVLGIPFDEPYDKASYTVSVKAGGQDLDLVATPHHGDHTFYVTTAFEISP